MIEQLQALARTAPELADLPAGWLTGDEQRILWALGAAAEGPVLEVGAWLGRSTVCIAKGIGATGRGVPFTTCELNPSFDDWELADGIMYFRPGGSEPIGGTPVAEFDVTMRPIMERPGGVAGVLRENLARCDVDHIAYVRIGDVRTLDFDGQFDVVFLDTAHSIEEIRQNAPTIRRLLAAGAVLACHDTTAENEAELRRQFGIESSFQVDSLLVAQIGDGAKVTYGDVEMTVRPGTWDAGMADEIWHDRYYTTGGFDIPDGASVLDIGGGIGAFAIFAATQGAVRVETYEPHPETYDLLVRNIEANGLSDIITAHNAAVAVEPGTMALTPFTEMADGTVNTGAARLCERGEFDVRCVGVHDVIDGVFDVVKVDIEGYEYDLFEALTGDEFARIGIVTMEFHHDDEATTKAKGLELAGLFERHGFDATVSWAWGQQGRIQARRRRT